MSVTCQASASPLHVPRMSTVRSCISCWYQVLIPPYVLIIIRYEYLTYDHAMVLTYSYRTLRFTYLTTVACSCRISTGTLTTVLVLSMYVCMIVVKSWIARSYPARAPRSVLNVPRYVVLSTLYVLTHSYCVVIIQWYRVEGRAHAAYSSGSCMSCYAIRACILLSLTHLVHVRGVIIST